MPATDKESSGFLVVSDWLEGIFACRPLSLFLIKGVFNLVGHLRRFLSCRVLKRIDAYSSLDMMEAGLSQGLWTWVSQSSSWAWTTGEDHPWDQNSISGWWECRVTGKDYWNSMFLSEHICRFRFLGQQRGQRSRSWESWSSGSWADLLSSAFDHCNKRVVEREALRWIQKYIAAFGGDPSKVTM